MHTIRIFKFKVDRGQTPRLETLLSTLGRSNPRSHPDLPFNRVPMLHFASLTLFEDRSGDYGDELVFESNFDGSLDDYLTALVQHVPLLDRICGYCQGYPSPGGLREFLRAHAIEPTLFHIGNPGRRLEHIKHERALRDAIDICLDRQHGSGLSERALREEVQIAVSAPPSNRLDWFPRPEPGGFAWLPHQEAGARRVPIWLRPLALVLKLALSVLGFVLLALTKLIMKLPWVDTDRDQQWFLSIEGDLASTRFQRLVHWGKYGSLVLSAALVTALTSMAQKFRRAVSSQPQRPPLTPRERRKIRNLRRAEDRTGSIQNHLASIVRIRPGWINKLWVWLVLTVLNVMYRTLFTRGTLAGVPGIHFGHWTLIDETRTLNGRTDPGRLLFLSNYDGAWESYLDDFIEKLSSGVGYIWGRSVGFPGTKDGELFKNWARSQQTRTRVWYSAYPDLTVEAINNHSEIRRGLFAPIDRSNEQLKTWFLRFGQATKTVHLEGGSTETETGKLWSGRSRGPAFDPKDPDIQGILLKGYEGLPDSATGFLHIDDSVQMKLWLKNNLIGHITTAKPSSASLAKATNIAFTASGLRKLGLSPQELATFAPAFVEGMTERRRQRILGDSVTRKSRPRHWEWGGTRTRVDAVLMVYEKNAGDARERTQTLIASFQAARCGRAVGALETSFDTREHFGFRDGVSQPIIEGTESAKALSWSEHRWHAVPPGEFVLGYPDGSGGLSHMPRFGVPNDALGRNGSYLVIRQLSQDVRGFWNHLERQAVARGGNNGNLREIREKIAARLVGRNLDGCPLISRDEQFKRAAHHPIEMTALHLKFAWRGIRRRTTEQWNALAGIQATRLVTELRDDNAFGFREDPGGLLCPVGAHMRRANPRDLLGDRSKKALDAANRHRILRRGRIYGQRLERDLAVQPVPPGHVDTPRGLLFMCFNSDIERQFEFIQSQWINNPAFDGLYCESDGFITPRFAGAGRATLQQLPLRDRVVGLESFVTVKGGSYFFLPSMKALEYLAGS